MSTIGRTEKWQNPKTSLSEKLVGMILGAIKRISSWPAAIYAAQTGRTHDRTRPDLATKAFSLANKGPSTHDDFSWACI
jgi:hypothetical protein